MHSVRPRQLVGVLVALLLVVCCSHTVAGVLEQLERIGAPVKLGGQRDFLPPDQAFRLSARINAAGELEFHWQIEPGYYLYRDKLVVTPLTAGVEFGTAQMPAGEFKDDAEFGRVEVYKHDLAVNVPFTTRALAGSLLETEVRYQGCAEDGICYPPIKKTVGFSLINAAHAATPLGTPAPTGGLSASDRIALELGQRSLAATLVTFFGLGLLLALTPCVLPMVPILSGIIVGQKQPASTARALGLSSIYVFAMALTYTLAGVVAGLAGQNLQAAFQHPAVIVSFAAVFVALAFSMFGFYELQVPAALQSRIDKLSRQQRSGSYTGVAIMGVLSAIIVGPCVAPPLAGALAYIGQTGSPLIGGAALFALGLGMGVPLIAIGTSAGAFLPQAGVWMIRVQQIFGVVFLAVAVWFLERVIPPPVALMLWAVLFIGSAVFLGALSRMDNDAGATHRLAKTLGVVFLVYGVIVLVGAAAGATRLLQPLAPLAGARSHTSAASPFVAVKSADELHAHLLSAQANNQPVMLYFYADWCIECKHLESQTFTAPTVAARLNKLLLLRADVTANDDIDKALLRRYELFGPPAVLFFRGGEELRERRLIGFANADTFAGLLDAVTGAP